MSLCSGQAKPSNGICSDGILINIDQAAQVVDQAAQVELSLCIPLFCCKPPPPFSLSVVLRNAFTTGEHGAQVALSVQMPLLPGEAPQLFSLCDILRYAVTAVEKEAQVELSL
jgi:hypothetical protein